MSTLLSFSRDVQGYNAYAPATATDKWSAVLPSGSPISIEVPSNYENWVAYFKYSAPQLPSGPSVWVDLTGNEAIAPTVNSFDPCTAELNPDIRSVLAGSTISVFTDVEDVVCGVVLYAVY